MDREALKSLRQLWGNDVLWPRFVSYLEKEYEKALISNKSSTDERALGRLFFIRELIKMRDYAAEAFKDG